MAFNTTLTLPNEILVAYSRKAYLEALPYFVFRNFVDEKTELQQEPGKTIQFLKLNNIASGSFLDEFTPVPTQQLSDSVVTLTVYPCGNAVELTEELTRFSWRDVVSDASVRLGRNYVEFVDNYLRDTFLNTGNIQYAGGAANDGAITSANKFKTDEIKDAVQFMKTLNISPLNRNGDIHYVCIIDPKQARDMRDDTAWISAHKYTDPNAMYVGEIGRYENVIFIETTQMPTTTGTGSGNIDIHSAIMIGANAVGYAESLPMELRQDPPSDLARKTKFGWYAILGAGIINDYLLEIRTA